MKILSVIILAALGIVALIAAALCIACILCAVPIPKKEDRQQIEDDLLYYGYDDHDVSGLLEED